MKLRHETAGRTIEFELCDIESMLADTSTQDEIQAALALGNQGKNAIPKIAAALEDDGKFSVQAAALMAIVALHQQKVDVSPLYKDIAEQLDSNVKIANAAAECFAQLGSEPVQWVLQIIKKDPAGAPDSFNEILARNADMQEVKQFVIASANSENERLRLLAASIIDEIFWHHQEFARQDMVDLMHRLQEDPDGWVRSMAGLGLSRAPKNVDVDFARVVRNLQPEDDPGLACGAELNLVGAQRERARGAIPTLLELRESPKTDYAPAIQMFRAAATEALCMIDPENARQYLRQMVDFEDSISNNGAIVISTLKQEVAADLLREWMRDERPTVVQSAIAAAAYDGALGAELTPEITEFIAGDKAKLRSEALKTLRNSATLIRDFIDELGDDDKAKYRNDVNAKVDRIKSALPAIKKQLKAMKATEHKLAETTIKKIEALKKI